MPFRTLSEKDFVGRNQELEVLYGISSEAKKGIATSIFLSGQHGTGKTELLSQLFNLLFWKQDEVAPFFYTINSSFISPHDFSMDYLNKFVRQRIAFQKKDISLIHTYAPFAENLMNLAEKSGATWAVDIIEQHLQIKTSGDIVKLLLSAISAPYQSYINTGMPVIVLIDEFHRTKEFDSGGIRNLWMLFETAIKSRYTPHVLTGCQAELQEMFFEKTSFGKSLELFNLSGLDRSASLRLFASLCENYDIMVDKESFLPFLDLFNGNPFYIRNFIQTARRKGKNLSEDHLWRTYFNEITKGKFYTCWINFLRRSIPQFDLRKVSLEILHHLCKPANKAYQHGISTPSELASALSINRKDVDDIINLLQKTGIVEMNFSTFSLTEDMVLTDIIKGLYQRERLEEPLNIMEETFMKERCTHTEAIETPLFEVTIPAIPRAELVVVNALDQIAKHQNISTEVTGQLQIALIDLLTNIILKNEPLDKNLHIRFYCREDKFTISVETPYTELKFPATDEAVAEEQLQLIKRYTDEIKFKKTESGTEIILSKNLKPS